MKRWLEGSAGRHLNAAPGTKTRITIRLDEDILEWFRKQAHAAGGGNYQTLVNAALREYVGTKREPLEATLRRVLREELPHDLIANYESLTDRARSSHSYRARWASACRSNDPSDICMMPVLLPLRGCSGERTKGS